MRGRGGGKKGHLRIRLHVKADEGEGELRRRREGNDIHTDLHLSLPTAVLGGLQPIHTVDGVERFHIPSGAQHGQTVTMKGKGVHLVNSTSHQRGDHHVHLHVTIPQAQDMDAQQLEWMRQWESKIQQQQQRQEPAAAEAAQEGEGRSSTAQGEGASRSVESLNTSRAEESTAGGGKERKKAKDAAHRSSRKKAREQAQQQRRARRMAEEEWAATAAEDEEEGLEFLLDEEDVEVDMEEWRAEAEEQQRATNRRKQRSRS